MKDNDALLFCEFRLLIYIVDAKRPIYYYYARPYFCTVADPEQIFSWGGAMRAKSPTWSVGRFYNYHLIFFYQTDILSKL